MILMNEQEQRELLIDKLELLYEKQERNYNELRDLEKKE